MKLGRGAIIQLQVIYALLLRETRTRFGAHQLGYLWAVLEPVMWIASFWAMYAIANRHVPYGLDTVGFLATGICTYELFSRNATRVGDAINANRPLLFYPQVQPIDLIWARAALETLTTLAVFALVMLGSALIDDRAVVVDDVLATLLGLVLAALLGAGLGLCLCMLGVLSNVVERLRGPLLRPVFWLSGLFYTLEDAPPAARSYLRLNPVLHAVEMVRDGWFPDYSSPTVSGFFVLCWILPLFALGLLLERVVRRRIELT
jgi:capsular polysaccharide transport system permease protein